MPDDAPDARPPSGRREFFAAGLARILRPLADAIERRLPLPVGGQRPSLRPPGAKPEREFLDTCFRCGACADACPAKCIRLSTSADDELRGTPTIDADLSACVVCDELACMKVCPSGALQLVDRFAIRMGVARVDERLCVRSRGDECRICVERCPIGAEAIEIDAGGKVRVIDPGGDAGGRGCVGCGVCQFFCPTTPKAIVVQPR